MLKDQRSRERRRDPNVVSIRDWQRHTRGDQRSSTQPAVPRTWHIWAVVVLIAAVASFFAGDIVR